MDCIKQSPQKKKNIYWEMEFDKESMHTLI